MDEPANHEQQAGTALAAAPTPTEANPVSRAKEGSRKMLERSLTHEQRMALKAEQKAAAKTPAAPAAEPAAAAPTKAKAPAKADPSPDGEENGEVHRFGEEGTPADEHPASTAEAEPEELTEEQLAALDEKTRKLYRDAQKEAAKVRKRAQEAEGKLTAAETEKAAIQKERDEIRATMDEVQSRAAALAGNAFAAFRDAHAVAEWGDNAREALVLLKAHDRAIKDGRADASDEVPHVWPTGEAGTLTLADRQWLEQRVRQAQDWFEGDAKVGRNKESAAKLVQKHAMAKGYEAAHKALLSDPDLTTRLAELTAKAAYYDMLNSRKAVVTFPDTAGAAKNASSSQAEGTPGKPASNSNKRPPSETPASTPRMVHTDGDGADEIKARKSALMERAKTAANPAERQKLLKEAILLGNPARIARR